MTPSRGESAPHGNGHESTLAYDLFDRLESVTDAAGDRIEVDYSDRDEVTERRVVDFVAGLIHKVQFDYDEIRRLVRTTEVEVPTAATLLETEYFYHTDSRLDHMVSPRDDDTTYGYDSARRLTSIQDSIGRVHTATYDLANRMLTGTEDSAGLSITTTYQYDLDSLLTLLRDADGFETSWLYDGKGRRTRVTYETGLFEAYTHDLADRLLTHRTQDGVITVFDYRDDDVLLSRTAGNLREEFTWNALGQIKTAESFTGAVSTSLVAFAYDGFSRLQSEDQGDGFVVGHGYDASHNPTSLTYPTGGPSLTQTFDPVERLATIDDGGPAFASYLYAGPGRVHERITGPTTQSFAWDGLRRLTGMAAGPVHDLVYDYDDFNRREYKQSNHAPLNGVGDVFDYDGGSRLSDVWYDAPSPASGPAMAASHLEIQQSKVQARTATILDGGTPLVWGSDALHQTTAVGAVTRTYDAKGNLTDNGEGLTYDYDAWNRLTEVSDVTGTLVTYELDALGRRSKRIEASGATTRYVYSGARLLEEYEGQTESGPFTLKIRYLYGAGLDELVALEDGVGARYYVYQDALGSVEAITDATGLVVERYRYDAFGDPSVTDATGAVTYTDPVTGRARSPLGNSLWFTGARWDPESGNYHMRARQYEPKTGRFVSRDPLGYVDGPNAYAYGLSDPANMIDPLGLESAPGFWGRVKNLLWNNPVALEMREFGARLFDTASLSLSFATGYNPLLISDYTRDVGARLNAGESASSIAERGALISAANSAFNIGSFFLAGPLGQGGKYLLRAGVRLGARYAPAGVVTAALKARVVARIVSGYARSALSHVAQRVSTSSAGIATRAWLSGTPAVALDTASQTLLRIGRERGCALATRAGEALARYARALTGLGDDAARGGVGEGTKVYRVWGDGAAANRRSWTTVNPGSVPNYGCRSVLT